jgi:hypothetical protein
MCFLLKSLKSSPFLQTGPRMSNRKSLLQGRLQVKEIRSGNPVLVAQELGDDRNFEVFSLISKDCRPDQTQPQNRKETTYESTESKGYPGEDGREDAKDDLDYP